MVDNGAYCHNRPLMNTDGRGYFDDWTERVRGAVFEGSNTLGAGCLEKVYQRALLHELRLRGIRAAAKPWETALPISSWKKPLSSS